MSRIQAITIKYTPPASAGAKRPTARSMVIAAFHILKNKPIKTNLREGLWIVMLTPESRPTWRQLEQLPYLSAVLWETLGVSTGIASRSALVAPNEVLVYKNHTIPAGTPVSESNYFVFTDPEIFPDPHTFDPDRWLHVAAKGEHLIPR
ncbi:hypothetical protein N7534_006197 [Penicillium rubens]|nr:hypothetical protein N7534_006197 [Penicillium rubens]